MSVFACLFRTLNIVTVNIIAGADVGFMKGGPT